MGRGESGCGKKKKGGKVGDHQREQSSRSPYNRFLKGKAKRDYKQGKRRENISKDG